MVDVYHGLFLHFFPSWVVSDYVTGSMFIVGGSEGLGTKGYSVHFLPLTIIIEHSPTI